MGHPQGAAGSGAQRTWKERTTELIVRLSDVGARPGDSRDDRLRSATLILASVLIALLSSVWVATYLAFGYSRSAAIPALYQIVTVIGLTVLARTRRFEVFRTTQLVVMLVAQHPAELPVGIVNSFYVLNIVGVTVSAYLMLTYFVEQRERLHRALEVEQGRSERLLLNVLPTPIADRLKDGSGVIAERHEDVSVLFADLVDFTAHTLVVPPEELVALLDRIFTAFDQLTEACGLEKIKTIGEAWGQPWVSLRIGIDTGPVVAGVIGRRKFIYDLWGDTVNTASRMQTSGLPGQIQVTARVVSALGEDFVVRRRGTVDLKGKGPTEAFLLDGVRPGGPDVPVGSS